MLLPLEENYSSQIYPQNAIYVLRSSYLCKSIDNSFASLRARHWHRCSHVDYLTHANYSGLPRHSKFIARPSPTSPSPASRMRSSSPLHITMISWRYVMLERWQCLWRSEMLLTVPPAGFSLMFPLSSCTCTKGQHPNELTISPGSYYNYIRLSMEDNFKIVYFWGLIHAVFQQHRTQLLLPVLCTNCKLLEVAARLVTTSLQLTPHSPSSPAKSFWPWEENPLHKKYKIKSGWLQYWKQSANNEPLCT